MTDKVNFNIDVSIKRSDATKQSKLAKGAWEDIERSITPLERDICDLMKKLGNNTLDSLSKEIESHFQIVIEFYEKLKKLHVDSNLLPTLGSPEKKKKGSPKSSASKPSAAKKGKGGKKGPKCSLIEALDATSTPEEAESYMRSKAYVMKKDEIINLNILKRIYEFFEKSKTLINTRNYKSNSGFKNQYLEMRVVTLMILMENSIKSPNEHRDFEFVSAMERFHETLQKIYSKHTVSDKKKNKILTEKKNMILSDFSLILNTLKQRIGYSVVKVFEKYPKFLFACEFDRILTSTVLSPYQSQIELMQTTKSTPELLCLYRVMIGGGKTTSAGALATHVTTIRNQQRARGEPVNHKLLFVCSVEPVRQQVGQIVYNMGFGLAVATIESGGTKAKITMNYNCQRKTENIVVILADIQSGIKLLQEADQLKQKGKPHDEYTLFVDEPTVGADQDEHPITKSIPELLSVCPAQTFLSSASLPPQSQLPQLISLFSERFPDGKVVNVDDSSSKIGCEIIASSETSYSPYTGITSVDQLKSVISRISEQPFIGKLFTAPTTIALYTNICEAGLTPASVYEYFEKASNRSQRKIQEFAVSLLQYMVDNCTDEQVTDICASRSYSGPSDFEPEEPSTEEEDDDGFEFARDEASADFQSRVNFEDIRPEDIVTKNSILYSNGALIASSNPIRYARDMGTHLLNGITNPSKLVSDYKKAYERYTKEIAQIEKADLSALKGKDGGGFNVDMLRDQRISSVKVPTIAFPAWAHINTREHLVKFSDIPLKNIDASKIRLPMELTQIDIDVLDVPEWVILLLFSGVGIYMARNNLLTDRYYETVLALAAKGQLAFLIADDSINYGANYPFSHVVISDDMVSTMSINTMFQLLGRSGRVGKSYAAFGHLGPLGLQKLQNYIHGVEESGHRTEAINLEKAVEDMFTNRKIQAAKKEEERIEYEQRRTERLLNEKREAQRQAFLKEQQRKLDEKRREEEKAQRISMAEFNRYRAPRSQEKRTSTSSNWRSEQRRDQQPRDTKRQQRTSRFGTSSGRWERGTSRTSTSSSSSDLEKVKEIIASGKYLPPHLKKLAQQHNLL